ncbi:MAG: cell division protein FtsZ [Marinospirillum sp.]|uniref:cell division protein FtsZ n=1 Tax=Marinospirillum sp. TaxID=2183934 RepID=UPI0019EC50F7|nr:cell division protein FtsZ [Marinospirillum sp.]MBE0506251.1 cell division protein FtsZ [Marinospirillum sp.]
MDRVAHPSTPDLVFDVLSSTDHAEGAKIRVIGVGGGGGNAVAHMIARGIRGVDYICTNTDAQALSALRQECATLQLGAKLTRGLGAGARPEQGRAAAEADRDLIKGMLSGADMVFITAGMGGGTGTGAAPVIARIARELGILTVAVVTRPFGFEGKKRHLAAEEGIDQLISEADSMITIPNEKLLTALGRKVSLTEAFAQANDVLLNAVQGIAELITCPGMINLDFADVTTVMKNTGLSMMGVGMAEGEQRARLAVEQAIHSPFLDDLDLRDASGILVNVTASDDLGLGEFSEISEAMAELASDDTNVIVGTSIDPSMGDRIRVTVVATGLQHKEVPQVVINPVQMNKVAQPERSYEWSKHEDLPPASISRFPFGAAPESGTTERPSKNMRDRAMEELDIPTFLRRQARA